MINIKAMIVFSILFLCNCVYYRVSNVDCLYVSDLSKDDSSWQEFAANLDDKVKQKEIPDSSKLLKFIIDHDRNGSKYYAKNQLPEEYFSIRPKDRKELDKKYSVYHLSWSNGSGCREIKKIDILEKDLPFQIRSIDYDSYGWCGKKLLLSNIRDTGIVHIKIATAKDTFYTVIVISKDSVVVQPKCKIISKTSKVPLLNPFEWLFILFRIPPFP